MQSSKQLKVRINAALCCLGNTTLNAYSFFHSKKRLAVVLDACEDEIWLGISTEEVTLSPAPLRLYLAILTSTTHLPQNVGTEMLQAFFAALPQASHVDHTKQGIMLLL